MKLQILYLQLVVLLLILCKKSLQWVELNRFECYEFSRQNMSTLPEAMHIPKQICYKVSNSKYYMGCLTVIDNELISGGCYETIDWKYRFLCINNDDNVKIYSNNQDHLGLNLYERPLAFCCKGPLCNSVQAVSDLVVQERVRKEQSNLKKIPDEYYLTFLTLFSVFGALLGLFAKWREEKNRDKTHKDMDNIAEKSNWAPLVGKERQK